MNTYTSVQLHKFRHTDSFVFCFKRKSFGCLSHRRTNPPIISRITFSRMTPVSFKSNEVPVHGRLTHLSSHVEGLSPIAGRDRNSIRGTFPPMTGFHTTSLVVTTPLRTSPLIPPPWSIDLIRCKDLLTIRLLSRLKHVVRILKRKIETFFSN